MSTLPTPHPAPPPPPRSQTTPYSQPTDTGVGRHWATQLLYAVDYLKRHAHPIRLEDLAIHSNVEALLSNHDLLTSFQAHERVNKDEKTGLYSYKPDFILRSKSDLYSLIRRYAPRGGLQVKSLRESWPQVGSAIEELEKEGKVFVIRTGGTGEREGQLKSVFLDDVGEKGVVDKEFKDLWHSLKTPIADELAAELKTAGLNAASSATLPNSSTTSKKKKGRKGPGATNRRLKITNTHLRGEVDLTKDYLGPGR